MTVDDLKPLENKLDILINLLAARWVDGKSLTDGALFLDKLGVDRRVTATIYDTSPDAVRASISAAKRSLKKK